MENHNGGELKTLHVVKIGRAAPEGEILIIDVTSDNRVPTKSLFRRRDSPVWLPYFTAKDEMDRALRFLKDNYRLEDDGARAGTVLRLATELGIHDLFCYLRWFCQFAEWRLQGFPEYKEKVAPKLKKCIEKFQKNVEALDQRHGVEFADPNEWLDTKGLMKELRLHMRDLGIHDNGYYIAMTSEQMTAPTLEALKENDPKKYRKFDEMRDQLWVGIYQRYRDAVLSAKQGLREDPGSVTAKIACIKSMLNFWGFFKDYQQEVRFAKILAYFIFPLPLGVYPAYFGFRDVCLPDDQVEMTIGTTPVPKSPGSRWYDIVFDFKADGVKVKCVLDPERWLQDIQVEGEGGEDLRLKLGVGLREFRNGEDNYSYDLVHKGSPLRDELSDLEHLGLGVSFLIPVLLNKEYIYVATSSRCIQTAPQLAD